MESKIDNIIIFATDIPDEERHSTFWHFLDASSSERTNENSCEIDVTDWDEITFADWIERLSNAEYSLDPNEDIVVLWHLIGTRFERFQLGMDSTLESWREGA